MQLDSAVHRYLEILAHYETGGITEVSIAPGSHTAMVGYFDTAEKAARAIAAYDGKDNVYVTLNPVKRDLLARVNNKLTKCKNRTSDSDILFDSWFFFDIDPKRPSGISSTDDELREAISVGKKIVSYLLEIGVIQEAILTGISGNGAYVLVRLPDYEITRERTELKKRLLNFFADQFSNARIEIDRTVFNPARLIATLGTLKMKGESIAERPHRRSKIGTIGGVKFDPSQNQRCEPFNLYALADVLLLQPEMKRNPTSKARSNGQSFDIEQWMAGHGIEVVNAKHWPEASSSGWLYVLRVCPFNPAHNDKSAFIVQAENGALSFGCHHNSCADKGWHDLRDAVEPEWRERKSTTGSSNDYSTEEWLAPISFHDFNLPAFPVDELSGWLRRFIKAEAMATQTPVDLAAMLGLAALSTLCARRVMVKIRAGWLEPTNIYTVTALAPGNRKSAVCADLIAPLEEYEQELAAQMRDEIAEATTRYNILKARVERAQAEAAKAERNERSAKEQEAVTLAQELAGTAVPASPRMIVDDITPERLASLIAAQGGRIAAISPEGDMFDLMAGRYSPSGIPNLGVYLKAHAGDTLRVDRANRPAEYVLRPALTIGLAIQPDVLRGLMDKPGFRGRGLLGRFLYALPVSTLGYRDTSAPPVPDHIKAEYRRRVQMLASIPIQKDESGNDIPYLLSLSPAADQRIREFQSWVEPQLAELAALGGMTDWAAKLVGAVARVAGLLHLADHAGEPSPWSLPIEAETVCRAIRIGEYLIPHARAAYAEMGSNQVIEDAKYVLRWIERSDVAEFKKTEVFEATKGRFGKVTALEPALGILVAHCYIRERQMELREGPGRKPSPVYEVNPIFMSYNSYNSHNSSQQTDSTNSTNSTNGKDESDLAISNTENGAEVEVTYI